MTVARFFRGAAKSDSGVLCDLRFSWLHGIVQQIQRLLLFSSFLITRARASSFASGQLD
jgi:hypothetical protein